MVPIHDTDVAEERWSKAEWSHYELWEKVEGRFRRNKRRWIGSVVVLFLILSSIPIIKDRSPKWRGLIAARRLSEEMNQIKREAGIEKTAFRLRLLSDSERASGLRYVVERTLSCSEPGVVVKEGRLQPQGAVDGQPSEFVFLTTKDGEDLGIPGLTDQFCYDPLLGYVLPPSISSVSSREDHLQAFGIISAKDLTEKRLDRITLLLMNGSSAEISFD